MRLRACTHRWLKHIWFLRGAEPACMVQLAMRMEPCVFAPGEIPELGRMYVIQRGVVLFGGRVLTSGKVFGEDVIVHNLRNISPSVPRCMTWSMLS